MNFIWKWKLAFWRLFIMVWWLSFCWVSESYVTTKGIYLDGVSFGNTYHYLRKLLLITQIIPIRNSSSDKGKILSDHHSSSFHIPSPKVRPFSSHFAIYSFLMFSFTYMYMHLWKYLCIKKVLSYCVYSASCNFLLVFCLQYM